MYLENEMKKNYFEQQKIYRNMLDGQKKDKNPFQIINERLPAQDV